MQEDQWSQSPQVAGFYNEAWDINMQLYLWLYKKFQKMSKLDFK